MERIEQLKANIEKLKGELIRGACSSQIAMETSCKEEAYDEVLSIIEELPQEPTPQPVREFPSSTEMIRLWEEETLPMLREKDFRGDVERMAYNAFLEGMAKGLPCKPLEKPDEKLEHIKKSWYKEGYTDGKYNQPEQFGEPEEDLEKEIERRLRYADFSYPIGMPKAYEIAHHFVDWQKERDFNDFARLKKSWYEEGRIDGKFEGLSDDEKYQQGFHDAKEQMMKDAIEREVKIDAGGYPYIDATEFYDYDKDIPLAKAGDKVKIIVVKEK